MLKMLLKKIPNPYKSNLIEAIDNLAEKPRPEGYTKLKGHSILWRIRVNSYRIVYQIKNNKLKILIIQIGHRRDIYESL